MALIKTGLTTKVIDPADVVEPEEPAYSPPPPSDPSNITLDHDLYNVSGTFIEMANIADSIAPMEESE